MPLPDISQKHYVIFQIVQLRVTTAFAFSGGFLSFAVSRMAPIYPNPSRIFKHAGFHCLGRRYQIACWQWSSFALGR